MTSINRFLTDEWRRDQAEKRGGGKTTLSLDHGVSISSGALRAALDLTQQYIPDQMLPGKATEVLDKACFRYQVKAQTKREMPDWAIAASSMAHLGSKVSF